VEYGQIMESVKMKVSDRKKRGKTGNVQFETLSRNQMAIGCEREWYGKGFVRAVPKRESSSLADLRNSVFVHAQLPTPQEGGKKMQKKTGKLVLSGQNIERHGSVPPLAPGGSHHGGRVRRGEGAAVTRTRQGATCTGGTLPPLKQATEPR
jgi:hypothetical protein